MYVCMYLCMYVCMYVYCVWVTILHGSGRPIPGQLPSRGAPVLNRMLFQGPSKGRYIPWVVPEDEEWEMGSGCR